MKKFALSAAALMILFSWTGLSQAPLPVAEPAPQVQATDALPLFLDAPMSTAAFRNILPIPDCGERCFEEGAGRGCIDRRYGSPRRTPCECRNGYWQCF